MKIKAIAAVFLSVYSVLSATEFDITAYEAELDNLATKRKTENPNLITERGICIDLEKKEIILDAVSTDITENGICEFAIITLNSGHDYEALFKVYATPTRISKSIELLGTKRGRSVDYSSLCFWSKGEHYTVSVKYKGVEHPITDYIFNAEIGKIMDPITFIYTSDKWRVSESGEEISAVESEGPGSIIPMYNETISVFDIPKNAPQGHAYEKSLVSNNVIGKEGERVEIILRPENRSELTSVRNNDIEVTLTTKGIVVNSNEPISPMDFVDYLTEKNKQKQDTYAQILYSEDVALTDISNFATLIEGLERKGLIKVEAPKNLIYYKAFLPQEAWLKRSNRLAQPLEIHLGKHENVITKKIVAIKEIWPEASDSIYPILEPKEYSISSETKIEELIVEAEAWRQDTTLDDPVFLKYINSRNAPLLVFAPTNLTFQELQAELKPLQKTHSNIFIFIGKQIIE